MLTEIDYKNILVFLARIQLSGQEASTFVELAAKLKVLSEGKPSEAAEPTQPTQNGTE